MSDAAWKNGRRLLVEPRIDDDRRQRALYRSNDRWRFDASCRLLIFDACWHQRLDNRYGRTRCRRAIVQTYRRWTRNSVPAVRLVGVGNGQFVRNNFADADGFAHRCLTDRRTRNRWRRIHGRRPADARNIRMSNRRKRVRDRPRCTWTGLCRRQCGDWNRARGDIDGAGLSQLRTRSRRFVVRIHGNFEQR